MEDCMEQKKLDKFNEIEKNFFENTDSLEKDKKPKSKYAIVFVLVGVLLVLVGSSYALITFDADLKGNRSNSISTCSLNMNFRENNPVSLLAAYPISDDKAMALTPYEVVISNNNGSCTNVSYTLTFEDLCKSCTKTDSVCETETGSCNCATNHQISSGLIRYQVIDVSDGNRSYIGSNPYSFSLTGTLNSATDSKTYQIRLWISADAGNDDLYVYGENGDIAVDSSGGYVTKNFCTKLKASVNAS